MRKFLLLAPVFLLLASAASAQILPKGNVFVGYSYNRFDQGGGNHANLNGWIGSLEGKLFLPWFGIAADVSGHYGTPNGVTVKEYNFLFGPRISMSAGKVRPFAHVLGGAAHMNTGIAGFSDSDTSFAYAGGGGLDYKVLRIFAWRVQGDYLHTKLFGTKEGNFRLSTGLVFNF